MGAILWTLKRLHPGAILAPLFSFSALTLEIKMKVYGESYTMYLWKLPLSMLAILCRCFTLKKDFKTLSSVLHLCITGYMIFHVKSVIFLLC